MSTVYLASTVLTGILLLAVGVYVVWSYPWRQWVPSTTLGARADVGAGAEGTPVAVLLLGGLAVVAIGAGIGAGVTGSLTGIGTFAGLFGGLLALYVTWGVYHICRVRGLHYAQAFGAGMWLLGLVLLAGIVAKLVMSG